MEDKPEFAQDVERQVREKLSAGVEVSATKVVPEEIEPEDDELIVEDF
jgi:recombination protein RecA